MPEITPHTQVCALFGHPVGHSLSPALHNAAFDALKLPFVYVAHDVAPAQLTAAMGGVRALGYRGLSVTIPHKVAALSLVDECDTTARSIGCINTVVIEGSKLIGYNSDGLGALGALRAAGAEPEGGKVVVLGSGGAARALAITLAVETPPADLLIASPDAGERQRLLHDVAALGTTAVRHAPLEPERLKAELADASLLLQCSPVGMHPDVQASLVDPAWLQQRTTVFDAVYNPRETRLLRDARAAGCRVVSGLEMFLGQAMVQFELWTGRTAPADVMRRTLEERL